MTSATSCDAVVDLCKLPSIESSLSEVEVDSVSGEIAVVEGKAAFIHCHQLAICSLDSSDDHGVAVILKVSATHSILFGP